MKRVVVAVVVILLLGGVVVYFFTDVPEKVRLTTTGKTSLAKEGYNTIAEDFLGATIKDLNTQKYLELLSLADEDSLAAQLDTDSKRKAFWINVYNAYIQVLLKKNPDLYQDRSAFFEADQVYVAGYKISFDKIEHGILRKSKTKWSLGYISNLFADDFVKKFHVDEVDYRIHFALNCGAKSCPPVAVYNAEKIDQQLDQAAQSYLDKECEFRQQEDKVFVPAILSWFRADFGGKKGIIETLHQYAIIPEEAEPEVDFKDYDWTLHLDNYTTYN